MWPSNFICIAIVQSGVKDNYVLITYSFKLRLNEF